MVTPNELVMRVRESWRVLSEDERPIQMRLFTAALGVIVLKDLQNHEPLRTAISASTRFMWPFLPVPLLSRGSLAEAAVVATQTLGTLAALLLVAQRHVRVASGFLVALYGYVFVADRITYTNNVYLLVLMLALVCAAGAGSIARIPAFPRVMGRVLVTVIYLTAAAAKLEPDWTSGYLMDQAAHHYHHIYSTRIGLYDPTLFQGVAIGSIGVEVFLAIAPWIPRAWPFAAALALAFHTGIELTLPVRLFSYLMAASFLLSAPSRLVAPVGPLRRLRNPWNAALFGVFLSTLLNIATASMLGAYGLVGPRLERTVIALAFLALILAFPREPRPSPSHSPSQRSQASQASRPSPPASSMGGRGRRWRAALVVLWATLHVALSFKPWLGGNDEFAWRMFTEDLKLQVTMKARWNDGPWKDSELYGAQQIWSSRGYQHHWSSLREQREFLWAYARWLLDNDATLKGVDISMRYQQNRRPWAVESVVLEKD